jgi:hypothetical protein
VPGVVGAAVAGGFAVLGTVGVDAALALPQAASVSSAKPAASGASALFMVVDRLVTSSARAASDRAVATVRTGTGGKPSNE